MKNFVSWATLVLYGISATAALAGPEILTTPARRDGPFFATPGQSALDGNPLPELSINGLPADGHHQPEKRRHHATTTPQQLTPAHLADLLYQLQIVYVHLSRFSATQDTGLLNGLLRLLGGVVPPLSDVIETVRAILIGDSVTVLEQLAIAQALGEPPLPRVSLRWFLTDVFKASMSPQPLTPPPSRCRETLLLLRPRRSAWARAWAWVSARASALALTLTLNSTCASSA